MGNEKINVRGLCFDNVTPEEAAERVKERLESDGNGVFTVFTPNAEILQLCIEQNEYFSLFGSASLLVPDGAGVIMAARILGTPLKSRVPGVELGDATLEMSAKNGYKVFFLGGKPGIAELAKEKMTEKYAGLNIVGTHDGYFKKAGEESDAVLQKVNESGADVLFVCLGVPAQEKWINGNKEKLTSVKVALALGGSLDVYSGKVKRAPAFLCRAGLEWLYRLMREPRRIGRMMKLPKFLIGTYRCKFSKK